MPSLLNDLSRPTRIATGVQMTGCGVIVGAIAGARGASDDNHGLATAFTLVVVGLLVFLVAIVAFGVWIRRADRAFWSDLETCGAELAGGRVEGVTVPGRVVRTRVAKRYPSYTTSSGDPQPAPSAVLVATVLTTTGARRAAALVPATTGLTTPDAPVLLRLHPAREDVAILVTDVGASSVRKGTTDPRWSTEPLPTDRSVVGGYLTLAGVGVGGLVAGVVVALLVSVLLR